jgi:Flp pilus assembly protein TadG
MVEFGMVALPVLLFIFGIMQTAYIVWADNLLHIAVDTAARCGAINSTTPPCNGTANMVSTAQGVFFLSSAASFTSNSTCSTGGSGVVGTYTLSFLHAANVTLTAKSCYF